jgi:hypothetical protein
VTDALTWQPIETAPKDGTPILLANVYQVYAGAWNPNVKGDGWPWVLFEGCEGHQPSGCCDHEDEERIEVNGWMEGAPTRWMPLPAAPTGAA